MSAAPSAAPSRARLLLHRARPHAVLAAAVLVVVVLAWWWADPLVAVLVTLAGAGGVAYDVLRTQADVSAEGLRVRRRGRETVRAWSQVRSGELTRSPAAGQRLLLRLDDGAEVVLELDDGVAERLGDHLGPHVGRVRLTDAARERLGLDADPGPRPGPR